MTTAYTSLLGLALPVTGELSGTWGDTVNDYITQYLDSSVAGTQTISGSQTAVTLSKTTNASLSQVGSGATGSAQYNIINCTGNPASMLTVTVPAASKTYVVVNATSTNQQVKIVGAGPTTGVTLDAGEKAVIAWNGSDFIKIATSAVDGVSTFSAGTTGFTPSTATSGAVTLGGTLATTNGGTGLTSFTANRVFYASSTSAIGQSANLTFDGTTLTAANFADSSLTSGRVTYATTGGNLTDSANLLFDGTTLTANALTTTSTVTLNGGTANGVAYLNGSKVLTTGSALTFDGSNLGVTSGVTTLNQTNNGSALLATGTTGSAVNNYISLNHSPGGGAYSYTAIQISGVDIFAAGATLSSYGGSAVVNSPGSTGGIIFKNYGTEAMRLTSSGLGIGTSSPTNRLSVDGNANITGNTTLGDATTDTVTVNGYMSVGGAPGASTAITVAPTALTGTLQYGVSSQPTGTSAATNSIIAFDAFAQVANAVFTVNNVYGLSVRAGSKGASATATNWHGIQIADQTQGTNNYGITSLVSSGSNKWNIYASGTANNAFAGSVRIGSTTAPTNALDVTGAMTVSGNTTLGDASTDTVQVNGYMGVGGAANSQRAIYVSSSGMTSTSQRAIDVEATANSSATTYAAGLRTAVNTQAASFTLANLYGILASEGTKGAGSTITNQHGVYIADQTQGTNNYGITSAVSSGANKWNIYASGTAANYFAGSLGIGTSSPASTLDVRTSTGATIIAGRTSNVGAASQPGAFNITAPNASGSARTWAGLRAVVGTATAGSESASIIFSNQVAGAYTDTLTINADGSLLLGGTTTPGAKVMYIANATTVPATNPSGGGVLYVEGGALKYRGSSGTVTTIAAA